MWNAEDSANKQLEKQSDFTNHLNVSLMVHENDLFWYITSYIAYEILKWDLQIAYFSQKWARTLFSVSDPETINFNTSQPIWNMKF